MLCLYLIRHADAGVQNLQYDHERVLTDLGKAQALKTGIYLQQHQIKPDLILHSDASRTTMTANIIATAVEYQQPLVPSTDLYNAPADRWLTVLESLGEEKIVFAVGHNLGISRFASFLAGTPELLEMETAAVYGFQFATDNWHAITKGSGKLILEYNPQAI